MSVFQDSLIAIRSFRGYADVGLPAGMWHFRLSGLGDATGGILAVLARFQVTGSPSPSQLWSLEQLMVNSTTSSTVIDARFLVENMDLVPEMGSTGALSDTYALLLEPDTFGVALRRNLAQLPLFMGQPIDNSLNSGFQVNVPNVDGLSLAMRAQGYFWTPGAINSLGGVRRPVDGLYSGYSSGGG